MRTETHASHTRIRMLKLLDATAGYWLCWILGLFKHNRTPGRNPGQNNLDGTPRRILVIRPGGMGDMILLLPALKQLKVKFPEAEMDIICERRNIGVLQLAGLSRNAIAYDDGLLNLLLRLRKAPYDMAIDTEQFHHFSAIMALLSRAPVRIGFKINPRRNPLYTHLVSYAVDQHEGGQFMKLLEPAGIINPSFKLEGIIPSAAKLPASARDKLNALSKKGKIVAIHPGSTSVFKQWNITNFSTLAHKLVSEHGCSVVLIGSRSDAGSANAILNGAGGLKENMASFAGVLSLEETAAVIHLSNLFVGGDSGLAHLAVALGTSTVVVFGPSDPEKWGTSDSRHRIAHNKLPCSPCFLFGYHKPCSSIECMKGVKIQDVLSLCANLLGKQSESASKKA